MGEGFGGLVHVVATNGGEGDAVCAGYAEQRGAAHGEAADGLDQGGDVGADQLHFLGGQPGLVEEDEDGAFRRLLPAQRRQGLVRVALGIIGQSYHVLITHLLSLP